MVTKYTSITCDASVPISEAFPSLPLPFRFDLHDFMITMPIPWFLYMKLE